MIPQTRLAQKIQGMFTKHEPSNHHATKSILFKENMPAMAKQMPLKRPAGMPAQINGSSAKISVGVRFEPSGMAKRASSSSVTKDVRIVD